LRLARARSSFGWNHFVIDASISFSGFLEHDDVQSVMKGMIVLDPTEVQDKPLIEKVSLALEVR
jgi:hypothetical protein